MSEKICANCGCVLEDEEAFGFQGEIYCEECLEALTTFCTHCGSRVYRAEAVARGHVVLCDDCYTNHYVTCDRCGRIVHNEDVFYESDDDDTPYCYSCHQELFSIHSYNYKPEPIFYGDDNRYFGVELEVDCAGENSENAKRVISIANEPATHLYCKHDGSLSDGFELVTHPMTLNYHMDTMPWPAVLEELRHMGYRSHQTSTCGLHIHVNRNSFGSTVEEQDETIGRILYFVEKNWVELVKFSRRTQEQLAHWAARYGYKDSPQDILDGAKGGAEDTPA